jgi:pimeloyl-ACP methyl ester carboxylesterase
MGMAKVSRRISVGDIELACRIAGRGRPVILVHGLACGQRMWFHQRRKLSDRHTVITYDQRGHGESDAPDDPSRYSAAHLARDLAGILDAIACDKVAVVGFLMRPGSPAPAMARVGWNDLPEGQVGAGKRAQAPGSRQVRGTQESRRA